MRPETAAMPWDGLRPGLRYGALGLPLAFVALPLYVLLPAHYAAQHGVPLAALGAVLLGARLLDAFSDPPIGRGCDRLLARPALARRAAWGAALVLAPCFWALFHPPALGTAALLAWCGALLVLTSLAWSFLSILHQAWGARLGGDAPQRARVVAWREGCALAGVLAASVLPSVAGLDATALVFAGALGMGLVLLARTPLPPLPSLRPDGKAPQAGEAAGAPALVAPLRLPALRRLLAVFVLNGLAGALPATLLPFFVADRLQTPQLLPLFLGAYFLAAALAVPLWVRAAARLGLARAWGAGMAASVAVFAWAALPGPGDAAGFAAVCVLAGAALGADLALPAALLAGVIRRSGQAGLEGGCFGWWNLAAKLNLALAAGLALPLLAALGYAPGARDADALRALALAYCALPCLLKTLALLALWRLAGAGGPLGEEAPTVLSPEPAAAGRPARTPSSFGEDA